MAIERVLLSLVSALRGKVVQLFSDNSATDYIWLDGSRKPHIHRVVVRIFHLCRRESIELYIKWTPRENNILAEKLSNFHDADDWKLNPRFFKVLDQRWGVHTIDRFASAVNAQCPRFNSRFFCPGTEAVNAFAQDLSFLTQINPPFNLIGKVVSHMRACKAVGIVIVPFWPKQP